MRLPLALALLVLAAGCVGPDDVPAADVAPASVPTAAPPAPTTGTLLVVARMPDLQPLAGVVLSVANRSATTDAEGTARLADLPAGTYALEARKEAHRTALLDVQVRANETTAVEVVLAALTGDQHAHEKGAFAHKDLYVFHGHFDCSATYVIITGDCLVVVENVTGQSLGGTSERHLIDFPLDATWATLVVEMVWTANASTPATGQDMTLALEPAEAPADGHAVKYARAAGGSPLAIRLENGAKHATATAEDMPNPAGGEVIRARAYVAGLGHNAGGAGFLGAGATAMHDFTLHVSIFYGDAAPQGYSALGGG